MAETVAHSLSEELTPLLQKERLALLSTVDYDTDGPVSSVVSWVYAADPTTIRIAVDQRSRIIQNIRKNAQVVLTLFAKESVYAVTGKATVPIEKMEGVPLKLALIQIAIEAVRDVMFYGSRISVEPVYEKTYNPQAAAKLDDQVMAALKNA